jgi:hypothetical protein
MDMLLAFGGGIDSKGLIWIEEQIRNVSSNRSRKLGGGGYIFALSTTSPQRSS